MSFTDDELRLQIAAMADGYFSSKNTNFCRFTFTKQRKTDRLLSILKRMGKKYSINRVRKNEINIDCTTKTLDKEFNSNYFKADSHQLEVIAEECLYWDGNCRNQFYTSSSKSSDFIQYCFTVTGKNSSIRTVKRKDRPEYYLPEHIVHKYRHKYLSIASRSKSSMEPYKTKDGYKYCFTVPTGMFIARNDKCIFITGNSDVESIFQPLLAVHSVDKVEKSIVYIDEICKKARKNDSPSLTRDVSGESVQYSLLKMMEGSTIEIPNVGERKHPRQHCTRLNTSNILFILGGSFDGIVDIISERQDKSCLGFLSDKNFLDKKQRCAKILSEVSHKDIIKYGIIPELAGRIPVLINMEDLTEEDLVRILTEPKNAIIKQYQELMAMDDKILTFTPEALTAIAKKAINMETGARGLRAVVESLMVHIMYEAPSSETVSYEIKEGAVGNIK